MKKTLLLFVFSLLFYINGNGQTCGANGITLTTQAQIDNFATTYPGCTKILGNVRIDGSNSNITNLNGLSGLVSIDKQLSIINTSITSLFGLDALVSIGSLSIVENSFLRNLTGLATLSSIGGDINIQNNASLFSLDLIGLTSLKGSIRITDNFSLTNLSGLSSLTSVSGSVYISNPSLTSLAGLNSLTSVGSLSINFNFVLANLMDLAALKNIGGSLQIADNPRLTNLSGLDNLTSIGDYLEISNNHFLESLTGLENLTSIRGLISIMNNLRLTNLTGLKNVDPTTFSNLYIQSNENLSLCEVTSICNYLANPLAPATISGNATKCISRTAVQTACAAIPIELEVFSGKTINNINYLRWQTATEIQNSYFAIERSANGVSFEEIGTQKAAGNSQMIQNYEWIDKKPQNSINYYRLKQVDFDGKYSYSNTLTLTNTTIKTNVKAFPNPTHDFIFIETGNYNQPFVLYDATGKALFQANNTPEKLDVSHLPVGMYFVNVNQQVMKFIKQ